MLRERKSSQKDFWGWLIPWRVFLNCLDFLMQRDSFPNKNAKNLRKTYDLPSFSNLNHDDSVPTYRNTKDLNFRPLGTGILLVTVLIVTWLPEMRGLVSCEFSHTWCWSPMKSAWSGGETCETSKICFFCSIYTLKLVGNMIHIWLVHTFL